MAGRSAVGLGRGRGRGLWRKPVEMGGLVIDKSGYFGHGRGQGKIELEEVAEEDVDYKQYLHYLDHFYGVQLGVGSEDGRSTIAQFGDWESTKSDHSSMAGEEADESQSVSELETSSSSGSDSDYSSSEEEAVLESTSVDQSSMDEVSSISEEEDVEDEEEGHPQKDKMLPDPDFLLPGEVQIPSMGDDLGENEVAVCVAGGVRSPSEFYLTLASDFPENMDEFICDMSSTYGHWSGKPRRERWMLSGKHKYIQPGSIVACFNPSPTALRKNEMVRAKVVRDVSDEAGRRYDVFLIDTGEYHEGIPIWDMFFLYEDFAAPPAWAIKCRLHLEPYYDEYHEGKMGWPHKTTSLLNDVVKQGPLKVRFVRQLTQENGEKIWEVSILELEKSHPAIQEGKLVEKEIIKKTMGRSGRPREK